MIIDIENSGFWEGIWAQIPGTQMNFENPKGKHAVPEVHSRHGVLPDGIFKIPDRAMGIWGKSLKKNPNFVHIFFTPV